MLVTRYSAGARPILRVSYECFRKSCAGNWPKYDKLQMPSHLKLGKNDKVWYVTIAIGFHDK